jgi:CRISPR-associated exonuclease Cas4
VLVFSEDELLPISALQHLAFCERQWALIHLEGAWAENQLTAEGRVMHDRAHEPGTESRGDIRISRGLRLRSLRLGLSGIADVVEFHRCGRPDDADGIRLLGVSGSWAPFPVEYKRGRPKSGPFDEIQLCAQALCLAVC